MRKIAKCLSDKPVKRWIDVLQDIAAKYNRTWHRATNRTPIEVFRGRSGFNSTGFVTRDSDEIEALDESSDLVADLNQYDTPILSNDESDILLLEEDPVIPMDLEYRRRYIERMKQDVDVHYHAIQFNPGDKVFIKRDFDMNPQTRRRKMDDFFESGTWTIIERVGSDNYKIRSDSNESKVKTISKNRIKK